MKSNIKICSVATVLIGLVSLISWTFASDSNGNQQKDFQNLSIKVKPNKAIFAPGELVELEIEVSNKGNTPVKLLQGTVDNGFLEVFVLTSEEYKEYYGPGWGQGDLGNHITLNPSEAYKENASILFSCAADFSHLNEDEAKRVSKGKILTNYVFTEPGTYLIKAASYVDRDQTKIESDPVQIVVNEPIGDDLKIWKKIKDDCDFGYLIQQGDFSDSKRNKKQELVKKVEELISRHPNGILASQLKQNLEKVKLAELKRKEFLEKIKIKKNE